MSPFFFSLLVLLFADSQATETARGLTNEAVALDDYGPCGLTSLFIVCKVRHVPVAWEELKQLVGPLAPDGSHSFADLSRAATAVGLHPVGLEASRAALHDLPMPAIVQVHDPRHPDEPAHLLVLLRPASDGVYLIDPPYAAYFLPDSRFAGTWTGNVLVFARDEEEAARIRAAAMGHQAMRWGLVAWLVGGLALGIVLTRRWWLRVCAGCIEHARTGSAALASRIPRSAFIGTACGACIALASAGAYVWWWNGPGRTVPPSCVFDKPVHELGELVPGEGKYRVTITNEGTSPLHIAGVTSTCACASVKTPQVVEPGQTRIMEVSLNIAPGPQNARLRVDSNDPEGPKTVMLSWHGKAEPTLVPYRIEAQRVRADQAYERTVKLVYPGGKSARVPTLERWESDCPLVEVRAGRNDPQAMRLAVSGLMTRILGEQDLQVTVRPPATPGPVRSACKLFFKYGHSTVSLTLPISVQFVSAEIAPEVTSVVFSALHSDELAGHERVVRVADRHGAELIVENAPAWLSCRLSREEDGSAFLHLKIIQRPAESMVQSTLQIVRRQEPDIRTPLRVTVFAAQP